MGIREEYKETSIQARNFIEETVLPTADDVIIDPKNVQKNDQITSHIQTSTFLRDGQVVGEQTLSYLDGKVTGVISQALIQNQGSFIEIGVRYDPEFNVPSIIFLVSNGKKLEAMLIKGRDSMDPTMTKIFEVYKQVLGLLQEVYPID